MIYVRDDDVLLPVRKDAEVVFRRVHKWITSSCKFLHIPTIVTSEIQQFPETVGFIYNETMEGRMRPEFHGYKHIDYAKLSLHEIKQHLEQGVGWMQKNLNVFPRKFYTPLGANHPKIYEAAKLYCLEVVDCTDRVKLRGRFSAVDRIKNGEDPSFLEEKEIFYHWWEKSTRLLRLIKVVEEGLTWQQATELVSNA